MARLLIGAVMGVMVGVVAGAALDLSAEPSEDVVQAAELAGVDPKRLEEALVTVGEPDPKRYLYHSGELAPPQPVLGATPSSSIWDRLAACESGGRWNINTGNGFYGGLQFLPSTWRAYGGVGMPHQASREAQIAVAIRTQAAAGWGQWPACSRRLGLR